LNYVKSLGKKSRRKKEATKRKREQPGPDSDRLHAEKAKIEANYQEMKPEGTPGPVPGGRKEPRGKNGTGEKTGGAPGPQKQGRAKKNKSEKGNVKRGPRREIARNHSAKKKHPATLTGPKTGPKRPQARPAKNINLNSKKQITTLPVGGVVVGGGCEKSEIEAKREKPK